MNDDFEEEMFVGDGTHDMDDISQGSEEDDFTSGPSTSDDVLEDEYRS